MKSNAGRMEKEPVPIVEVSELLRQSIKCLTTVKTVVSISAQESVRTGTVMRSSGTLRKWVITMYLMTRNLKGVSSMKLHRDLGIA